MKNKPGCDLLADGEYEAEILTCDDRISRQGNPMLEIMLRVWGKDGQEYAVQDWITATPRMQWKLRHLCESAHVEYEQEDIPAHEFRGKNVRVQVTIEEPTPDRARFGPQNRVADYLPRAGNGPTVAQVARDAQDADIPF